MEAVFLSVTWRRSGLTACPGLPSGPFLGPGINDQAGHHGKHEGIFELRERTRNSVQVFLSICLSTTRAGDYWKSYLRRSAWIDLIFTPEVSPIPGQRALPELCLAVEPINEILYQEHYRFLHHWNGTRVPCDIAQPTPSAPSSFLR